MHTVTLRTGEKLKIVESELKDAARIIDYLQVIGGETDFLSFGLGEFDKTEEEEQRILSDFITSNDKLHIYGEINGEIVALLDISTKKKDRERHSAEFGISVLKKHWGQGIGTAMIQFMMDWAKDTGVIRKLNLKVVSNNFNAINLYRKFSFSMEGRLTKEFYVNGSYYDMISMGYWIE